MKNYFKRRFKTLWGVKLAISIKRPYDWIRLKWRGEKILSQKYSIFNHGSIVKVYDSNGKIVNPDGYTITNMVVTQSMMDDLKKQEPIDIEEELKSMLNDRG